MDIIINIQHQHKHNWFVLLKWCDLPIQPTITNAPALNEYNEKKVRERERTRGEKCLEEIF